MEIRFDGTHVLITGGSTGIGRASALQFARDGADVMITYRSSSQEAQAVVAQIAAMGRRATAIRCDMTRREEITALFQQVSDFFGGRLDILVNNAGDLVKRVTLDQLEADLLDEVMELNLNSVFHCVQLATPLMKRNPEQGYARIINLTSIAGYNGGGVNALPYSAAKGGVVTLTRGLAKALVADGITVNAVAPGTIDTPFHQKRTIPEDFANFIKTIPMGRAGTAEECAGAISFLASSLADYMTGQVIHVNGGQFMGS